MTLTAALALTAIGGVVTLLAGTSSAAVAPRAYLPTGSGVYSFDPQTNTLAASPVVSPPTGDKLMGTAISPDGRNSVEVSQSTSQTGVPGHILSGNAVIWTVQSAGSPITVTLSPDGKYVFVGETDATLTVDSANIGPTGLIEVLDASNGAVLEKLYSPRTCANGCTHTEMTYPKFVTVTNSGTSGTYNVVESGRTPGGTDSGPAYLFSVTPNSGNATVAGIQITPQTGATVSPTPPPLIHTGGSTALPSGNIVIATADKSAYTINPNSAAKNADWINPSGIILLHYPALDVASSPDGQTIFFVDGADGVSSYNIPSGTSSFNWALTPSSPIRVSASYISISPDGRLLYISDTSSDPSNGAPNGGMFSTPSTLGSQPMPPLIPSQDLPMNRIAPLNIQTTTVLRTGTSPSLPYDTTTLYATVTSPNGTPAAGNESVTFYDGTTVLGQADLVNGVAQFQTAFTPGPHTLSASYSGDLTYGFSTSANLIHQVQTQTTTAVSSSNNPAPPGTNPTLTATVSQVNEPAGQVPTPQGTVTFFDGTTSLGAQPVSGTSGSTQATATLTPSPALTPGAHQIHAVYSGDVDNQNSSSQPFTQDIQSGTQTSFTLSPSSPIGSFQAYVNVNVKSIDGRAGTPTGTVSITGISTNTQVLDSNGNTSFPVSWNSGNIFLSYSGDALHGPSATSEKASTVTLGNLPSALAANKSLQLTATATGMPPVCATCLQGTVTFSDRFTPQGSNSSIQQTLATASPDGSTGVASATVSSLGVGTHVITANYSGGFNFFPYSTPSSSLTSTLTVSAAATTTTLNGPASWAPGQTVGFTAQVATDTGPVTTGSVSFTAVGPDGTTYNLGIAQLDNTGAAVQTTALLNATGTYSITATYLGTNVFASSTSPAIKPQVQAAGVQVKVASSAPTVTSGSVQALQFTVTVAPTGSGAPPSGNVLLCDFNSNPVVDSGNATSCAQGGTPLGTATLAVSGSGNSSVAPIFVPLNSLAVGTHNLIAEYSGNSTYKPAFSPQFQQFVQVVPNITFTPPATAALNTPVTLSVTLAGTSQVSAAPKGTVQFTDGTTPLTDGSGNSAITLNPDPTSNTSTATLATSFNSVGGHQITVTYTAAPGEPFASGGTVSQTINVGTTASGLSVSLTTPGATTVAAGQQVELDITVTGIGTPTGTVQIEDNNSTILKDDTTGSTQVPLQNGSAVFKTSQLVGGTNNLIAFFSGDGAFAGTGQASATPLTITVSRTTPTIKLSLTQNSVPVGTAVTFTATVSGPAGSGGSTPPTPSGSVDFKITDSGGQQVGTTATQSLTNGTTTDSPDPSLLRQGTYTVTATYSGDSTYSGGESDTQNLTVTSANAGTTTTSVVASPTQSGSGQAVTFTATVTVGGSLVGTQPVGTVTFSEGTTTLKADVQVTAGTTAGTVTAQFTTSSADSLSVGTHTITATFNGSQGFPGSSGTATETVVNTLATAALTASPNPGFVGKTVTLTVTVTGNGATPTGTVDILDGTTSVASGLTLAPGTTTGTATKSFSTTSLAAGNHTLTAVYNGDSTYSKNTSPAITETITTAFSVTTTSLPDATVGKSYSATLKATGGTTPYTWAVTTGTLPAGLTLDKNTGTISGTPTSTGTAALTISATDSSTPALTTSQKLNLAVKSSSPPSNGGSGNNSGSSGGSSGSGSHNGSSSGSGSSGNSGSGSGSGSTGGSSGTTTGSTNTGSKSVLSNLAHTGAGIVAPATLTVLLLFGGLLLYRRYRQ